MSVLCYFCRKIKKTMKLITIILFFCLSCALLSCRENYSDVTNKLIIADTLLSNEQIDAAETVISSIESKQKTDYENAYYALIKTRIVYSQYKEIENCSLIDIAVNYFKKNGDDYKLADSYFYKADILYDLEDYENAIFFMKEAEYLAKKLNDNFLLHKVYMKLFYYNMEARENKTALFFAKKENEYAKLINSDKYLAYSFLSIATVYRDLGNKDSMRIFASKFIPLLDKIDVDEHKSYFYNCLGDVYFDSDINKSFAYYKKALEYSTLPQTCAALAEIYLNQGDTLNAAKMVDIVSESDVPDVKISLFEKLSKIALRNNDAKSVYKFMSDLVTAKDSLNNDFLNDKTIELQHLAEVQKENEIWHLKIFIVSVTGIVILFLSVIAWIYMQLQKIRKDKKLAEHRMIIEDLRIKIKENGNDLELQKLLEKYMQPFKRGKELYERIENGGNFGTWKNADLIEYINYCRLEYGPFLAQLNEEYEELSPLQIIYMLQKNMNIPDRLIADRLVVNVNSLATYRTRIDKKRKKNS